MQAEQTMTISICPEGDLIVIYSDPVKIMIDLGTAIIKRASHVEPSSVGEWTADLSPMNGPILGPFDTRQAALVAEVAWLQERMEQDCSPFRFTGLGPQNN